MAELDNLKNARSLRDIAVLLGYQPQALSYILYKIPKDKQYTIFSIPKKSGGLREIKAPVPRLKELQARLANLLTTCTNDIALSKKGMRSLSHGFKKEHSIVTNAQVHKKRRYVFNLDLRNFFPSINFGRVRGYFIKNKDFKLHSEVATIIAQIACHENELPQGSPCSPIISNLVGHLLDIRLAKIAKRNNCTYSRYADDLTFSSSLKRFPKFIAKQRFGILPEWLVGNELENAIQKEGFEVNSDKTRMQYRTSRQSVTGLVVNKKVNIKSEYYRTARSMCHSLFRTGQYYHVQDSSARKSINRDDHLVLRVLKIIWHRIFHGFHRAGLKKKRPEILLARLGSLAELDGILSHIYYVKKVYDERTRKSHNYRVQKNHNTLTLPDKDNNRKEKLFAGIKKLYFKFLFYKNFFGLEKPLLICEGKTDNVYLKCALKKLAADFAQLITIGGGKIDYRIKLFNYSNTTRDILFLGGGTSNLVNLIRFYRENMRPYTCQGRKYPVIILIDNDDGATEIYNVLRNVTGDKSIDGSKPFYFVTDNLYVVPTAGKDSKIEHFFDEATQKTEVGGKRFNPDEKTFDPTKEYSKHIFAEAVIKKNKDTINFNEFKKILKPICDVLDDYQSKI